MIRPGLTATVQETVSEEMTAERLGSGDVPVLGTPALVALVEAAAVAAVAESLEQGMTSVGARIELDHVAPTAVGASLNATAELRQVDGRTLHFSFEVSDPAGPMARGTHVRVVVEREAFLARATQRT
ncbi:MAG TPA: hotdog domain-containing protein [Actinomycetota bacterium]|nr:hotdog domain-containing protein [Actinomycetota bacterium]